MAFTLGTIEELAGDVSTLNWIVPGYDERTEGNLGYQAGRLALGYWIALLKQELKPADFRFAGTTLRSGGRLGAPLTSAEADRTRPHVHDLIRAERGLLGTYRFQKSALACARIEGPDRIAKVLPVIRHDGDLPPDIQYPMGGGGLQWTLRRKCGFLLAAFVAPGGSVETPAGRFEMTEGYDARARLRRYLCEA